MTAPHSVIIRTIYGETDRECYCRATGGEEHHENQSPWVSQEEAEESIAQQVADLWHANNGWIPGGDRERLQAILGIPLDPPNQGKCNPQGNISFG